MGEQIARKRDAPGMTLAQCVSMPGHFSKSPSSLRASRETTGRISHWWGIVPTQASFSRFPHAQHTGPARARTVRAHSASCANGVPEKGTANVSTVGSAVILDFDYLSEVYVVREVALGEVFLSGSKEPPVGGFEILLHTSDGFVEYFASIQEKATNGWLLEINAVSTPRFLQMPTTPLGRRYGKREIG